jgi:hypothetical protein
MPIDVGGNVINSIGAKVLAGTGVVTSGLTCYLDAAIPASYPGSGTTWYDLSGNGNHGTLTNGPTFSGLNGGVIVLDGTNDYVQVNLDYRTTDCTVIGAARYISSSATERIFSGKDNNWLMGFWSSGIDRYYAEGWVTQGPGTKDTAWRIYATKNKYSTDTWSLFGNGVLIAENANGSSGPYNFAIGGHLGQYEFSNAHVSAFLTYNRILTDAEILQNYNALRGRIGI